MFRVEYIFRCWEFIFRNGGCVWKGGLGRGFIEDRKECYVISVCLVFCNGYRVGGEVILSCLV